MNARIKQTFSELGAMAGNTQVMDQFFSILELPDEQFKAIYPDFRKAIEDGMAGPAVRQSLLEQYKTMPSIVNSIDEEVAEAEELLREIISDETLSVEKKDFLNFYIGSVINIMREVLSNPREKVEVKIMKIHENAIIPTYAHPSDAGADIYAVEDLTIKPHTTAIVPTGLKVEIPLGYMINIAPRSGLSAKTALRIANSWGIIDSEYRGEIGIIVENTGNLTVSINKGDKIAQMLILPAPMIQWKETDSLNKTSREDGGFGSTDEMSS